MSSLRQRAGALLLDVPRIVPKLLSRHGWAGVRNRRDSLALSPDAIAFACEAEWSSRIHACEVFPPLGTWLMRRALEQWPVSLQWTEQAAADPQISFVIPHRGRERLPLLRVVVASILAQRGVAVECVVVEQSAEREVSGLPAAVRVIHVPFPSDPQPWRKSLAFNQGVAAARAGIVVCHDGDIVVPDLYAAEIVRLLVRDGYEVAFPQRFLFDMSAADTDAIVHRTPERLTAVKPESVRQNWRGGTVAIRKTAFQRIGGFDERFVGWGGEDFEFYDRALTLRGYRWGYLPFVHLWHPPQDTKAGEGRAANLAVYDEVMKTPRGERVRMLTRQPSPVEEKPLVSIIVPSFNQGKFIRKTLDSILSQDYRPLEILVIDGASTDETVAILHEYDGVPEVKWISEPDSGVVEAVNKGFARATGEIGAIQSSDDFYLPGAVRAGVSALLSDPALAFVFGDVAKVDAAGREVDRTSLRPFSLKAVLTADTWIPQPSTFFRLGLAKELGGWSADVPYAADTDLWLRMALQRPARKIDRVMAQRTMHDAQRDQQGGRIIRDYRKMTESLLQHLPSRELRRAAKAGTYLVANHYSRSDGPFPRVIRLWRAALLYPPLFRRFPFGSFIPAWYRLRQWIASS